MAGDQTTARLVADRYELERIIGRGGMGAVWQARDRLLEREVAVKEVVLPVGLPDHERDRIRDRVLREARAAARLNHPASVTVYDVVDADGTVYIVMELIEARDLAAIVADDGPLPAERAAAIGLDVLAALEAAHAQGIVHRDVKPSNVMVTDAQQVKLTDFGIASVKDDPRITSTGLVLGSPSYMAPEQAEGKPATPATDLWGLGATLAFAVSGEAPFGSGEAIAIMHNIVHGDGPDLSRAGALRDLISRLLARDPSARPDAATVRKELDRVARGIPTAPTATVPATPEEIPLQTEVVFPRESPRRRWLLPTLATLALVALFAVVLLTRGNEDTPQRAAAPRAASTTTAATDAATSMSIYRDATTGYRIAYPKGWTVERRGRQVRLRDPDSSRYLLIDWVKPPGPSPVDAWKAQSASFGSRHANYREVGIRPTTFKGMNGAEWEYTYTDGGADLHAIDLGFVTSEYGFALNFQTKANDWDAAQSVFSAFKSSFAPPN